MFFRYCDIHLFLRFQQQNVKVWKAPVLYNGYEAGADFAHGCKRQENAWRYASGAAALRFMETGEIVKKDGASDGEKKI